MNSSFPQNVWEKMKDQLVPFLGDDLHIIIPESWSDQNERWFKDIETQSFRESLRYNTEELQTRLEEENVLFLFVILKDRPEGVILGYPVERKEGNTFYLDTFAIRTRGKGIGRIVLSSIIQWAKLNRYDTIELDTEAENEVGIPLQRFYETFGFKVLHIEDDGNITMSLTL
ncbi:MAG: GNAT family N-acetyltransferase [Candidatus Sifarchaeia archaeon]